MEFGGRIEIIFSEYSPRKREGEILWGEGRLQDHDGAELSHNAVGYSF